MQISRFTIGMRKARSNLDGHDAEETRITEGRGDIGISATMNHSGYIIEKRMRVVKLMRDAKVYQ